MTSSPVQPDRDDSKQGGAVRPEGPSLPHERDQQNRSVAAEPNAHVKQAAQDLANGQVDTDLRATPGLDAGLRGDLVQGGDKSAGDQKPRPDR